MTGGESRAEGPAADREAAAAQLAALRSDRAALAARAMQPWWYDVTLGLLTFGVLAQSSLDWAWLSTLSWFAFLGGCLGLMTWYRRHAGFQVGSLRSGRTQRALWMWLAVAVVVFLGAIWLQNVQEMPGAMVVAGAVLGVGAAVTSRWWTRLYVAELRGEW
ncbi:hypothetical protein [Modestobacter sp. VKM Ac-2984]|uniref:hypothetical protein n=1 Tax=Modestobacter sp. VKM Ac-2984 TaxID=3004138 RepID=UPI0022AA7742|nr:hypothetical protein [Modestobacter sp. VKM Ac-2984]MCZ2817505.1 hypothetical protein [Modestobacter sp. VKM Ac-2984]